MPIVGMSSVWYPVENWERAKQFYTEILGLRLGSCNDEAGWAAYQAGAGGTPFFLVRKPGCASRDGGPVVSFEVTDCQLLLQQVIAFGAKVDVHVQESDTVRVHTIHDPDGNALELSETKTCS